MRKFAVVFILLVLLLAVPAGVTHAAPAFDQVIAAGETVNEDVAIWGGSLKVEEGGTVDGDVSVFGGTAILNGHVTGDVVVFGGTASMAGVVDGDLVLFGGTLSAASSADVDGDCVLIGGTFAGDGASNIHCDAVGEFPDFVKSLTPPRSPEAPRLPRLTGERSLFAIVSSAAGQS
ncbi:MAG: polymer-forming cytoskeletal protein, partial [Chloroflexota bacterium]